MTMTERVAQAIYETNPIAKWPPLDDTERQYWLAAARAAETIVIEECALKAEVGRLRALFEKLQTIVGHIEGINDERDSVPILIAVRRLVAEWDDFLRAQNSFSSDEREKP